MQCGSGVVAAVEDSLRHLTHAVLGDTSPLFDGEGMISGFQKDPQ